MPEIHVTIDPATGEYTVEFRGLRGRRCLDLQRLVETLAGTPTVDQPTAEYCLPEVDLRPHTRPGPPR